MSRFLRFIIEEMLAGHAEELKETTIGLAVFDRAPNYDPRVDPIVRVEARRLREKLSQYYETDGQEDSLIIELPRGHYAPSIRLRTDPTVTVTSTAVAAVSEAPVVEPARRRRVLTVGVMLGVIGLVAAGIAVLIGTKAGAMRERDSIVLGEFANRTGESVFDFTLRQALAAQLSQSPFLSIVPDERIRETLRIMGRSSDDRLSHDIALEVCRRQSVKAMLTGSISAIGRVYVLALDATNCQTGEAIAREQRQVDTKEGVLRAIGRMASRIRNALGESLASIQRFDAPIEQTTTPSLEALRAYALGQRQRAMGNEIQSIAFFLRAIELDTNFASAYNSLSNIYSNLGEAARAKEFAKLAFERRDHVSERERLYITYQYYDVVAGDQARVIETLEVWKQSFPREFQPVNSLANIHNFLGHFERAVEEGQEAIKRNPAHGFPYSNLAVAYRGLGRFDDAQKTAERAVTLNVDTVPTRLLLYQLAILAGDEAASTRYLERVKASGREFDAMAARAQVAAWAGRIREARQLYEEAVQLAERRNLAEAATAYLARATWMELVYGNKDKAGTEARRVLARKPGYESRLAAALTLAATGSVAEAEAIAGELEQSYSQHTSIKLILVPQVMATAELARKRPERAIEQLRTAAPYENGLAAALAPIYLRGQSYLMQRSGSRAAEEFQRILAHRGTDPFSPFYAVAPLGLARALAMAGNVPGSLQAYEQFLAGWKSADPDVPVLLEAREEYDRMKHRSH
jgi:tetratricopeptide (TPR) repeat protein